MTDLALALELAERGYHLVPVTIRRRASDGRKIPEFHKGWTTAPTVDSDVIRDWSVQHPGCSFAIACGPSGIDVADLDPKDGGPDVWASQGLPPSAHEVTTPSGGRHLYWRQHPDGSIGTSAGQYGRGVDTRGDRGVVFAPGAVVLGVDGTPEPRGYVGALPKVADLDVVPAAVRLLASTRTVRERSGQESSHHREWIRDAVSEQRARVRAFDPRTQTGFRDVLMGAGLVLGRAADADCWPGPALAAALEQDADSVWGAANDDDREWIRRAMDEGPALERWTVRVEPGSNELAPPPPVALTLAPAPPTGITPLGNTPVASLISGGLALAPSVGVEVPAPAGTSDHHAQSVRDRVERLRVDAEARRLYAAEVAGPQDPPSTVSLAALLCEPDEGPAWLVDGLWPAGGKVLLAAAQKTGKTTMVGNLVRCLVDGAPFLARPVVTLAPAPGEDTWRVAAAGYAVPAPRVVALLDFEMTRRKLKDWLREQRIGQAGNVHVELMRGRSWDIRDPEIRAGWATHLQSIGAQVLIVDPIGPVLHGLGIDENDNSAVGGFLAALDALVRDAGVSELFVAHHTGHGTERARGASSFMGWPDANWRIVREELGDVRAFAAEGRDVWVAETVTEYDAGTRRLWLGQGSRAESRSSGDVELVLAIVAEECEARAGQDGPGVREIRTALMSGQGWGKERADRAVTAARNAGVVHAHPGQNRALLHRPGASCGQCTPSPGGPST